MAELHDIEVEQYLKDCVDIEPIGLEDEFVRLPADLAYWNHRFAEAVKELQRSKFVREQVYARRYQALREELGEASRVAAEKAIKGGADAKKVRIKAPTVDDITAAVMADDEYAEAKGREIEAEGEKARLYGVVDAVRTKRDMVIQMGADRRVEMQGDPVLRDQVRGARES